jgi:hypothetical protein
MTKRKVHTRAFMKKIGRMGARAAKRKLKYKDRKSFGKMGGRPRDPRIDELVQAEGITRKAAWFRLRQATGGLRGRPRDPLVDKLVKAEGITRTQAWARIYTSAGVKRESSRKKT